MKTNPSFTSISLSCLFEVEVSAPWNRQVPHPTSGCYDNEYVITRHLVVIVEYIMYVQRASPLSQAGRVCKCRGSCLWGLGLCRGWAYLSVFDGLWPLTSTCPADSVTSYQTTFSLYMYVWERKTIGNHHHLVMIIVIIVIITSTTTWWYSSYLCAWFLLLPLLSEKPSWLL